LTKTSSSATVSHFLDFFDRINFWSDGSFENPQKVKKRKKAGFGFQPNPSKLLHAERFLAFYKFLSHQKTQKSITAKKNLFDFKRVFS
jgi:hypothetical protein